MGSIAFRGTLRYVVTCLAISLLASQISCGRQKSPAGSNAGNATAALPAILADTGGQRRLRERIALAETIDITQSNPAGLDLGMGVNTLTGQATNSRCVGVALDPSTHAPVASPSGSGQHTTYELEIARSHEEAARRFATSLNVSFGGPGFDVTDQKLLRTAAYHVFYLARVRSENTVQNIAPPDSLTTIAKAALKKSLETFLRRCGNRYVTAVWTGGILDGVLNSDSMEVSEYDSLTVHVNEKIGLFGDEVRFDNAIHDLESTASTQFRLETYGGTGATGDFVTTAQGFGAQAAAHPWRLRVQLARYSPLADDDAVDFDSAGQYMAGLSSLYDSALALKEELIYAAGHRDEYKSPPDSLALVQAAAAIEPILNSLVERARTCVDHPTGADACGIYPIYDLPKTRPGDSKPIPGQAYLDYMRLGNFQAPHTPSFPYRATAAIKTSPPPWYGPGAPAITRVVITHTPLGVGTKIDDAPFDIVGLDNKHYLVLIDQQPNGPAGLGWLIGPDCMDLTLACNNPSPAPPPPFNGKPDWYLNWGYYDPNNHIKEAQVFLDRRGRVRFFVFDPPGSTNRRTQ
jgi:hypothetical protein